MGFILLLLSPTSRGFRDSGGLRCEGEGEGWKEGRKEGRWGVFVRLVGRPVGWLVVSRERGTEERNKYCSVNVASKVPVS